MDDSPILTATVAILEEIVLPLTVAAVLGGVVGWERESWHKPAGLRTHMMVALGSATFTLLTLSTASKLGSSVDPSRIIQGVATGIGFLGAGTIIQSRRGVRGITTAAGIWVVGGIGACCGAAEYATAGVAVVLSLLILAVLAGIGPKHDSDPRGGDPEAQDESAGAPPDRARRSRTSSAL